VQPVQATQMNEETEQTASIDNFDLTAYEIAVAQGRHREAYQQLLALLKEIDSARITLNSSESVINDNELLPMTRAAAATVSLILDPRWTIEDEQYIQLAIRHDSFAKVFACSVYGSSEHVMTLISSMDYEAVQKVKRWYLCISLSSPIEMYQILLADKQLASPKVVAMLGQCCVLTKEEEDNKSYLIENVATFLEDVSIVSDAMIPVIGKTWMECSYAVSDRRHLVKLYLNKVIKRSYQIAETERTTQIRSGRKSIGIVIEVMRQGHSMFRCYRNILAALKKEFDVIIYAKEKSVDDAVKALGHQFVAINFSQMPLEHVGDMIRSAGHDMLYYPSIGMEHWTVIMCNYRLAPVQTMTYGHPASSCSDAIDAVFFDADVASDPDCLTEKIIKVGEGFNAFARNSTLEHFKKADVVDDGVFHIAITSSFIKLNWLILYICSELVKRSEKPLHFHFFVAGSGRMSSYISKSILCWLEKYTVYEEMAYDQYLSYLSRCSMRLGV
jgi:predicted O-linked N-acetylglucosamine transferase (SPINDLY family)